MQKSPSLNAALHTVILFTTNMENLAQFYMDALGIGPYERLPGHLGCQIGSLYFGFDQIEDVEGESPRQGITLWFEVDDLQAAFDRAITMGAIVRYPPTKKPWGAELASVHDPDGNVIGFTQRNLN